MKSKVMFAAVAAVLLSGCPGHVKPIGPNRVGDYIPTNSSGLTIWRNSSIPRPGTIVSVGLITSESASATVESDVLADLISPRLGATPELTIELTDAAGISAAAKFIGGRAPGVEAKLNTKRLLSLTTEGTSVMEVPPMKNFLSAIQSADAAKKTGPDNEAFNSLRMQPLVRVPGETRTWFIVTKVFTAKKVTWKATGDRTWTAGAKCESTTLLCGSLDLSGGATGSGSGTYSGTGMVVFVVLKRIGKTRDYLSIDRDSSGPKVVNGD